MKHTPGPWKVVDDKTLYIMTELPFDKGGHRICTMTTWHQDQVLADARLIAAAPDLLEALQELYANAADSDSLEDEETGVPFSDMVKALKAIKLATGED